MADAPAARYALETLAFLSRQSAPVAAATIARELSLPRSTTYRILNVLTELDFAAHIEEERRYALGTAAFELGFAYSRQGPLQWVGRNTLIRLVDSTRYSGHLAVLHGDEVLYIAEERSPGLPSLVTDVGVRLPAHLTASGLSMLACLSSEQLRALYPKRHEFVRRYGRGPRNMSELRSLLHRVREDGYAVEEGLVTSGFASIACAVRDHRGHPAAAVTLTFPSSRLDAPARTQLAETIGSAAAQISRVLGVRL